MKKRRFGADMSVRTAREEELQIEVDRLVAWLQKIKNHAYREEPAAEIEWLAGQSILRSARAAVTEWGPNEDRANLGVWPPKTVPRHVAED